MLGYVLNFKSGLDLIWFLVFQIWFSIFWENRVLISYIFGCIVDREKINILWINFIWVCLYMSGELLYKVRLIRPMGIESLVFREFLGFFFCFELSIIRIGLCACCVTRLVLVLLLLINEDIISTLSRCGCTSNTTSLSQTTYIVCVDYSLVRSTFVVLWKRDEREMRSFTGKVELKPSKK